MGVVVGLRVHLDRHQEVKVDHGGWFPLSLNQEKCPLFDLRQKAHRREKKTPIQIVASWEVQVAWSHWGAWILE